MIFGFVIIVVTVVVSVHLYLWKRLVRDTMRPGPWRRAGGFVVLALALLMPATLVGTRALPHRYQAWLAWPGYIWLALFFYLLVGLLLLEPVRLALRGWARRSPARGDQGSESVAAFGSEPTTDVAGSSPDRTTKVADAAPGGAPAPPAAPAKDSGFDPSRRLLIARSAAALVGVATVGTVGFGIRTALGPPQLLRVPVRIPKLPASMDGFRIAVVSDIHVGPLLGRPHTERITRIINGVDPDMVAIVGDLVDGTVDEMGDTIAPLADLRARYGSFFVTGNHEYFSGHEPWIDEVNSLGVRVLRNERVEVAGLDVAGVNDVTGDEFDDGPDFDKALGGRDANRPAIMLAHQPVLVSEAARRGVDLQLSGHTHGGQMVPFNLLVSVEQPVLAGLAEIDGTQVYVTRGAGFWGPPVRVGAPPDISVIELRANPR